MTSTTTQLLELLAGPMEFVAQLDLSDAGAAAQALEKKFPLKGDVVEGLRVAMRSALDAGDICDRGQASVRFSRLAKPCEDTHDLSVDFVWMEGPGINHRHPKGEVSLCFATDGDPRFDGQPEGWVPYAPDSAHVPTVTGGHMLIVYFLPGGAVEWIDGGKA